MYMVELEKRRVILLLRRTSGVHLLSDDAVHVALNRRVRLVQMS
jgi:hypothetical protein